MRAPLKLGATEAAPRLGVDAPAVATGLSTAAPANLVAQAGLFGTLAERFDALTQRANRRADIATETEMLEAGAAAGDANPGVQMEGGGLVAQAAFNRGAAESGQRRLEISVRERLSALQREHEADPAAFGRAAVAYRNGVAGSLPAPMRTTFMQGFDALAQPFHNQAQRLADQRQADQRLATFAEAERLRIPSIEAYARLAPRDPAAARALELEQGHHVADLVALGPRGAFRFAGQDYPADPTRAGALSLVQMEERRQVLHDRAIAAAAMGAYEAGPRSAAWIDAWERHETSPQGSGLTSERVRALAREMRADLAHRTAMAREAQSVAWSNLEGALAANLQAVQLTGKETSPVTDAELRAAGRTPQFIRRYRDQVAFGTAAFTARQELAMATPEELAAMKARVMPGGDLFALNPAGAAALVHQFDARAQNAAERGLAQRLKDLQAQAETAPPEAPPAPRLTMAEAQAAGWTREQLDAANANLADIETASRTAQRMAMATPEELRDTLAALQVTGERAAENRAMLRGIGQVLEARQKGLADDPAGYVHDHGPGTKAAWAVALKDPSQIGPAIALTLDQQRIVGVAAPDRQPLPKPLAQQLALQVMSAPTDAERVARLQVMLGSIPDGTARAQVLGSMGRQGLSPGVQMGAGNLERIGPLRATRIASELAIEPETLKLPPALARSVADTVSTVYEADDRVGGLRNAQSAFTGSARFLAAGLADRARLEHVARVRARMAGGTSDTALREAYDDLFGGNQVVNRTGYLLTAPAGTDIRKLQQGLGGILASALEGATPAQRAIAQRGAWIDAGADRFAFYPAGSAAPLARDGKPVIATLEQALAAAPGPVPHDERRRPPLNMLPGR